MVSLQASLLSPGPEVKNVLSSRKQDILIQYFDYTGEESQNYNISRIGFKKPSTSKWDASGFRWVVISWASFIADTTLRYIDLKKRQNYQILQLRPDLKAG